MGQGLETLQRSRVRIVGKKYSPDRLRRCLDAVSEQGVVLWAARAAGFSTTALKYYLEKSRQGDPGFIVKWGDVEGPFHELFQAALDEAIDRVEGAAFRRALGYKEVLTHHGRVQYRYDPLLLGIGMEGPDAYLRDAKGNPIPETVDKQSEDLQMFILKARRPDIYGNKSQVDVMHRGGVMVVGVPAKSSAELEKMAKQLATEKDVLDVEFIEVPDAEDGAS